MVNIADRAFNRFIPPAEELWKAGGAEIISTEVDPGRFVDIPYWNPVHTEKPKLIGVEEPFVTKSGRELGRQALYQFEIDNIDYLSRVLVPDDALRTDHDFSVLDSMAWGTTINGFEGDNNAKTFVATQMGHIATGSPHSGKKLPLGLEFIRVPRTLLQARKLSLAYTAQVEQEIAAYLTDIYDLPKQQYKKGPSRGSNITPGHFPYAKEHGAEIVGIDIKGHTAPDKIELRDMPAFGAWCLTTALGGIAATTCLARDGELSTLNDTVSFNPNFIASALTGTMRSLASGETGRMIDWMHRDVHGIDVIYGLDWPGGVEAFEILLKDFPNVRQKVVRGGTHAALLHPIGHIGQIERMRRAATEFTEKRGVVEAMDWNYIHGVKELTVIDEIAA